MWTDSHWAPEPEYSWRNEDEFESGDFIHELGEDMQTYVRNNLYSLHPEKSLIYMHEAPAPDCRVYIGQAVQTFGAQYTPTRWQRSGRGYQGQSFYEAVRTYSWNDFGHFILYDNLTKPEADEVEEALIFAANATNPDYGFNISVGNLRTEGHIKNHQQAREVLDKYKRHKCVATR